MSSSGKVKVIFDIMRIGKDIDYCFISQYCPDGKVYGPPGYDEAAPLTDEELKEAPHVKAACNGYVPAEIAPYHKQIGTCNNQ